jgi:probable HAF family extracellular repeat protein
MKTNFRSLRFNFFSLLLIIYFGQIPLFGDSGSGTEHPYAILRQSRPSYDRSKGQLKTNACIENTSDVNTIPKPIICVIEGISSSQISLANPDGYTADGRPYKEFTSVIDGYELSPGAISGKKQLIFNNPLRHRFQFTATVMSGIMRGETTITPEGGKLVAPSGMSVQIPEGAVADDKPLTVDVEPNSLPPQEQNRKYVSLPMRVTVGGDSNSSSLACPATISIPFDPAALPTGAKDDAVFVLHGNPGEPPERLGGWHTVAIDHISHTVTIQASTFSYYGVAADQPVTIGTTTFGSQDSADYNLTIDYIRSLTIDNNAEFMERLSQRVQFQRSVMLSIVSIASDLGKLAADPDTFEMTTGMNAEEFARNAKDFGSLLKKTTRSDTDTTRLAEAFDGLGIATQHIAELGGPAVSAFAGILTTYGRIVVSGLIEMFESGMDRLAAQSLFAFLDLVEVGSVSGREPVRYELGNWGDENPRLFTASVKGSKDQSDSATVYFNTFRNLGYRPQPLPPFSGERLGPPLQHFENVPYVAALFIDNSAAFDKEPSPLGFGLTTWNVEGVLVSFDVGDDFPRVRGYTQSTWWHYASFPRHALIPIEFSPNNVKINIDLFAAGLLDPPIYYDSCPQLQLDVIEYSITDLGTLIPNDLNINDQVVGQRNSKAVFWENGSTTIITALPSNAYAINDSGFVVGYEGDNKFGITKDYAFIWKVNEGINYIYYSDAAPFQSTYAEDISNSNRVVGWDEVDYIHVSHSAFFWDASCGSWCGYGPPLQYAYASNDSSQVVGMFEQQAGYGEPIFYRAGFWSDSTGRINILEGVATAINDNAEVVGCSYETNCAFLWHDDNSNGQADPAEIIDLGTLGGNQSEALSINNQGQIVGWAENSSGQQRAFIYENGKMYDLNNFISEPGWVLEEATAINDNGHIIGTGTYNGESGHGFLLTK